ncbi:CCR4-NOT transcription complex subunit 10 [Parasteatoda tepidariorum]|uniref:CCR4-NOT transcription complex subunit 10 n=1 Tax=Parasteatoda tepidariorum TaxID=114398 RepID=UPI00077FC0A8|nr:CCR4-NOT transcription complex subunit 10 [Parasteatoda tepidariorum]XP_042913997.1 CCR4-NOT transcription complex subunit 10 [Parasteatoda tepidariorum]
MCDEESDARKASSSDLSYQAVPDVDREMAAQAYQEFELEKFEQCASILKKLMSRRPQDSKVMHNLAVTEYYLSNCKKTEIFNKKMVEVCRLAHIDVQDLESLDDVDSCVALYNQAIVMFHLHQYHSAISILDKVFQFVEPLEENLARNVCFLLLELYLCVYQPRKALCLIGYLETMLFSNNKNCGKSNSKEKDGQKEENGDSVNEIYRRRLQLCKARCYAMIKTSKACKREIKNLMSSGTQAQNIPAFYLKSQLEYQRGNYRKAIKLLNSVTLPTDISKYIKETGDFLPTIYYNNVGCIHFYMGKPNLGCHYITKALECFESEIASIADSREGKSSARPLHLMSTSTQHQLMYNLGMQRLQAQRYLEAFKCFKQVIPSYHSNPRLWLRIAECCINLHKPDNTAQFVELKNVSFIKSMVGTGPHRKLILNSSSEKSSADIPKTSSPPNSDTPSLHFALLCLKNALHLVGENPTNESLSASVPPSEETDSSEESNILSTLPSNFVQGAEILSLRNSILIAASYVSLCLGDVLLAHEYAKSLLAQPRISGAHKFLAHLYAGESLLLMDRITDAVEHLNYQCTSDIELAFPVNSSEVSLKHQTRFDSKLNEKNDDGSRPVGNVPNWFPNAISSAKFITQYNLAVAYAVREEWSKSLECLMQTTSTNGKMPPRALSLLIYVQLHQGTAENTKAYVKQYSTYKST